MPDDPSPLVELEDLEALWDRVGQLSPTGFDYEQFTAYVRTSAERLPALLSGEVPAHEVLFPDGSHAVAERIYQDRASMRWGNSAVTSLVSRIADAHDPMKPLRVLEIGAGTGSTTQHVLSGLRNVDFRYTFTDRSEYFLPAAQERWGDDPRWTFSVLDIDEDPMEQGYSREDYDLVCAFGVLENARDIPGSLQHLTRLTRDEGVMLLSEPVDHQWWVYVSQIFLMTRPDAGSRHHHGLFPPSEWWTAQLRGAAGGPVAVLPESEHGLTAEKFAFFATRVRATGSSPRRESVASFLADRLPTVMVPQQIEYAARLPLTRNGKIDKRVLATLASHSHAVVGRRTALDDGEATASPSTREDPISATVARLWAGQLGFGEAPAIDDDPFNLGANSITAAAVAGRIRDEIPELSHATFETVLRALLTATSIRASVQGMARITQRESETVGRAVAGAAVVLEPLRQPAETDRPSRRTTLLFGDSLADAVSPARLATALPEETGTIIGVTVPDDDWFIDQPAETLTETVANLAAAELGGPESEEYVLIGYSYGALVAIETARRLIEAGRHVHPLGLIDPHVIPAIDDDRVTEIMCLASRGADLGAITGDEESPLTLDDVLSAISYRGSESGADASRSETARLAESALDRLSAMEEPARWHQYCRAINGLAGRTTPDELRRGWVRYRHVMRAATVRPDSLVSDAVIVQPLSSHGFLAGAHADAAQTWEQTFIGRVELKQVAGDHFTLLSGDHVSATTAALLDGLARLGAPGRRP